MQSTATDGDVKDSQTTNEVNTLINKSEKPSKSHNVSANRFSSIDNTGQPHQSTGPGGKPVIKSILKTSKYKAFDSGS